MKNRLTFPIAFSASLLVGMALGTIASQVTAPSDPNEDATAIKGVTSGVDGSREKQLKVETEPMEPTETVPTVPQSPSTNVDNVDTATPDTATPDTATTDTTETNEPENTDPVFTPNRAAMQSIRGIKGIDTIVLQNLEAVLRMQTPPPPPMDGGTASAAALMTMETDQPPDPEEEPDGREELTETELEGS